uniref:Orf116d n=1 Tax=Batis maritima TaxID=4436 RepID=A0A068BFE4_BATMA|nr:orf116d [Batis maritima]AIC83424.1 orf116d [Batis maritima]
MSLKQSVLSLFDFRIPSMSRTTKPPPQIKMSPTRLSRQEPLFSIVIFLAWRVRSGETKERCFLSVKSRYRPPMLPRPAYRGIEREDRGPEQVGLGYRAVSAVGGDRGRARTVHRRV